MTAALIIAFEFLATLLYPLGQLTRLSFLNQQVNLYAYELAMACAFILLILKLRVKPFKTRMSRPALILMGTLAVSFLLSIYRYDAYENAVGFLYFARLGFYLFHFLYLLEFMRNNRTAKQFLGRELAATVLILVVASVIQYLFYPNLRNLLYQGWDPHLYRVFAFFFEPYLAGAAIGLSIMYVYFRGNGWGKFKWVVLAVLFVLLMLTFSRTVYAAAFLTFTLYFLQRRSMKRILLLFVSFAVLAYLIPKPVGVGVQLLRTFSIETRLRNAGEGIAMWIKSPVAGVGYNRIRYAKAHEGITGKYGISHAAASYHSSFVTMLASAGVMGFLAFGYLLFRFLGISTPSFFYILFLSLLSLGDNALLHTFMLYFYLKLLAYESAQSSLE